MEMNLLDRMLSSYQDEQISITVTLQNRIRLSGKISAFDSYVILLEGQKREMVYRHAVSCLSVQAPIEQKKTITASKSPEFKSSFKPIRSSARKTAHHPQQPELSASDTGSCINSGMKEGLLKWIQEQKAAK